jgi:type 2 lantibiotic biosynthesis protein LanM
VEVNADRAAQRLLRWRSQTPFTSGLYFAQRLALDGISEDELLCLLGEPLAVNEGSFAPAPRWWVDIARACAHPAPADSVAVPASETPRVKELTGFLALVAPLMSQARQLLRAGIQELIQTQCRLPFEPHAMEDVLCRHLPRQLLMMVSRTLVLELHVARLQGLLQGETPEERFQSFVQRLRQPEVALALFQEYPVLARQVVLCIDNWLQFGLEFLRHLCADWEALRIIFSPHQDPGLLVEVKSGVGDKHRGGRSVLIAQFSSGLQVVYKPKSLAVDVHVQELLAWINVRGDHSPFRTLTILDRGTHGWVEFVAAHGCTSAEEVRRFYERQGGYLALLYALEATDFHYENLIAAGEHPVLIDLESLFHPRASGIDLNHSDQLASQTLAYSVLRVGLLPQRVWSDERSEGVDLSGLGAEAGQLSPRAVLAWEAAGTDAMRFTRKRLPMPGAQNRPTLPDTKVEVLDYAEVIVQGFTAMYRLLWKHREELLAVEGPLARFAQDEVRVILRPTRAYGLLLQESFHPDMLRDALERDQLFDRLWVAVEQRPYLAKVIAAEREDLLKGDIPLFATRPAARDLWTSADGRLTDFLDEPGLDLVQRRVRQLGDKDLKQQLWFIRAALATLSPGAERTLEPNCRLTEPQTLATHDRLLAAAQAVGDRLEELALHGEQDVSWIGLTLSQQRRWSLLPLGVDLYAGLPGVALFLAYLGAITEEKRYSHLARAALATLRSQLERRQSSLASIGGFSGCGGVIYCLTHLGILWDQPDLLTETQKLVELLPPLIDTDDQLDLIGGATGCIGSLLSLNCCAPSERTRAVSIQCGDHLLARAQTMQQGIAWLTQIAKTQPLTGFSHGAAGMAWALGELAVLTGEARFQSAAQAAMTYERSLFSQQAGNWPDLRNFENGDQAKNNGRDHFMTAWCHGAPGIGLARLQSLPHLGDDQTLAEIEAALQTTVAHGFGRNHSLCHGDLGNLELLLQARERLHDPGWHAQVNRIAAVILESIEQNGWRCGNPLGVESPGLMTGLAGIGYGLLRLAEPACVPSVLVLAPPIRQFPEFPAGGQAPPAALAG